MIKAIIFDCFGVLVQGTLEQFRDSYLGGDADKIQKARDLDRQANLGLLDYDQLLRGLAELAGITDAEARKYLDNNPPNEPLLKFIQEELKPKYKIGFLSNASDDWLDELFTPEQVKLFDSIILSYKTAHAKPDPEIFELSCRELGIQASEAIMVDDIERYCTAAQDLGMQAICYKDFDQFKKQIVALTGK